MRRARITALSALAGLAALAGPATAQQAAPQAATPASMVGQSAPEFSGRGATRHGRVADPIQVRNYRGKTIVLAFFFRARTSG